MRGKMIRKRIIGSLAAAALLAAMLPGTVFAAGANVLDSTATDADPAGPGYDLTLTGLEDGDTASYYKLIEQDVDKVVGGVTVVGTQQWKLTKAVDANGDGIVDGTEDTDFGHKTVGPDGAIGTPDDESVKGLYVDELIISDYETDADETKVTSDTRQLTADMVNALATALTNNSPAVTGSTTAAGGGTITVSNAAPGLYMFVAVPKDGDTNYIYKPIFVSCDYYNSVSTPEDDTHKIEIVANGTDYAEDPKVFKRSPLSIDKKCGKYDDTGAAIDLQNDVAVGDTIDFSITVPIPTYTENYVSPMFYITDMLTEGLDLNTGSIKVEVKNGDGSTVTTAKDTDYKIFTKKAATVDPTASADATDYYDFKNTLEESSTMHGFVVQFLNDDPTKDGKKDGFLYRVVGAPTCTITYQATVKTTEAQKFAQQVNQMDNTAKLNFSQDPNYVPDGYFSDTPVPVIDPETGQPVIDPETGDPVTTRNPDPDYDPNKPDTVGEHPDGEEGKPEDTGLLQDKTRHYTFDIDADVLGRDQSSDTQPGQGGEPGEPLDESEHDKTSEIRKIWIGSNGQVIQSKDSSLVVKEGDEEDGVTGESEGNYGWLEGAEFTLTKTKSHEITEPGIGTFTELAEPAAMKFDASTHILDPAGENPKSDAKGYIAMKGLDAGVYVLKEIKAPLGYSFNPNIQYEITITPTYVMEPATPTAGTTPEDGKGGADDLILESYQVKIVTQKLDNNLNVISGEEVTTISTYNLKKDANDSPISLLKEDGSSNVDPNSDPAGTGGLTVTVQQNGDNTTAMIVNKRLGILPATGGTGLIYYLLMGGGLALFFGFMIRKVRKAGAAAS